MLLPARSKNLKQLLARKGLPDMGRMADVAEFLTRSGYGSVRRRGVPAFTAAHRCCCWSCCHCQPWCCPGAGGAAAHPLLLRLGGLCCGSGCVRAQQLSGTLAPAFVTDCCWGQAMHGTRDVIFIVPCCIGNVGHVDVTTILPF